MREQETRELTENEISKVIVEAAIEVHRVLGGPSLIESIYKEALVYELKLRGLHVERQKPVPVIYKSQQMHDDLRLDVLVNDRVIIECKATTDYHPVFEAKALTYLRLTNLKLAMVINFGERLVKDGIHRDVNGL